MAGWNNKNCCCEAKAYTCADGTVDICCVTLEVSTWVRKLPAYARNTDPDDICGYVSSPYPHNNVCGYASNGSPCGLPSFSIFWGIQSDGTIALNLELYSTVDGSGNYVPPVFHRVTGLDPNTWYLSPVTFTLSGVTYTIEVCPDPHTPFPEWPLTDVFYELRDSTGALMRAAGGLLCGEECDPSRFLWRLRWKYSIYTDEITISPFVQARTGPLSVSNYSGTIVVPYDDGNWADDDYTTTLTAPGVADLPVSVLRVDSCTIPPPPEPCEVENACFPDGCPCIIDGSDGSLYRTLTADISGPVTATGLTLIPYLAEGWDYSSGGDSIAIRCTNGGVDPYYVYVSVGGTIMFGSIPAGGFDCTPDGLDIVDITVTDGITTMVLYTL
jgi:hypothetical protein